MYPMIGFCIGGPPVLSSPSLDSSDRFEDLNFTTAPTVVNSWLMINLLLRSL